MMTSEQRYWWGVALELKLRKSSGDAFQDFFSNVMTAAHGTDFVRVRAYGALGDKGCDGYLLSVGQVFQCYGSVGAQESKAAYLIKKMGDDFANALSSIPGIMKEWHMVHNFVDGLPISAVEKLNEIIDKNKDRKFGFIGAEGFEERVFALEIAKIEQLLGIIPSSLDAHNLQSKELRDLVGEVAAAADAVTFDLNAIRPVPPDKLEFNKLPSHWTSLIAGGWQNVHHVKNYLDRHHDPLIGEQIAQAFRVKYQYLKSQNLSPGTIMTSLYEMVTGKGHVTPQRQVAAQALIAHLFEACDIFEAAPAEPAN
jgi:hypothetical protein